MMDRSACFLHFAAAHILHSAKNKNMGCEIHRSRFIEAQSGSQLPELLP